MDPGHSYYSCITFLPFAVITFLNILIVVAYHAVWTGVPWPKVGKRNLDLIINILCVDFTIQTEMCRFYRSRWFYRWFDRSCWFCRCSCWFCRSLPRFFVQPSKFPRKNVRPHIYQKMRPSTKSTNRYTLNSLIQPKFHTEEQIWHIGDLSNWERQ